MSALSGQLQKSAGTSEYVGWIPNMLEGRDSGAAAPPRVPTLQSLSTREDWLKDGNHQPPATTPWAGAPWQVSFRGKSRHLGPGDQAVTCSLGVSAQVPCCVCAVSLSSSAPAPPGSEPHLHCPRLPPHIPTKTISGVFIPHFPVILLLKTRTPTYLLPAQVPRLTHPWPRMGHVSWAYASQHAASP